MRYQTIINDETFDIDINEDGRIFVNGGAGHRFSRAAPG